MASTRKVAAILVSDVVGYSRLAGADEDRTLSRLRGLRSDWVRRRGLALRRARARGAPNSADRSPPDEFPRRRRDARDHRRLPGRAQPARLCRGQDHPDRGALRRREAGSYAGAGGRARREQCQISS